MSDSLSHRNNVSIMSTIICIEIITELTETMLIFIMAYIKVGELEEWVLYQDGMYKGYRSAFFLFVTQCLSSSFT